MKPLDCRSVLCAGLLAVVSVVPAFSQAEPAAPPSSGPVQVTVNSVRFNTVSGTGWYEMDIQLQTASAQPGVPLTGRLKVSVDLGIDAARPGGQNQIDLYHSSAQFVGLPLGGGTYDVRFYLPPEIVVRDRIQGPAKYYAVELSVDGKALPMSRNNVSSSSLTPQTLESFRAKVASDGAANNGIFLPQYLTPFFSDFSRPSPSALRIESAH